MKYFLGESQQKQLDDWCNKDMSDLDLQEAPNFEDELQAMKKLSVYDNQTVEVRVSNADVSRLILGTVNQALVSPIVFCV